MAEFCLECLNKYIMPEDKPMKKKNAVFELDLCEGCGEWKPCVIGRSRIPLIASIKNWMYKSDRFDKWVEFWVPIRKRRKEKIVKKVEKQLEKFRKRS